MKTQNSLHCISLIETSLLLSCASQDVGDSVCSGSEKQYHGELYRLECVLFLHLWFYWGVPG